MIDNKEIVLITGANTGIGFETVKALFASPKPYHILLGSRDATKGEKAVAELERECPSSKSSLDVVQIDITNDEAIERLFEHVKEKFGRVDILVNNAGANFDAFNDASDPKKARELFNKSYDVNVSSTQVMTSAFAPLLIASKSPRLLFLTSGLATLEGAHKSYLTKLAGEVPRGWPKEGIRTAVAYRSSKTALNMMMLSWHHLLKGDGVRVWSISPGFLATSLGGKPEVLKKAGAGDPATGAELIQNVIEGKRDEDVGKVIGQPEWVGETGIQAW
ncbi:short-chain alcohol dehydrogenase [Fusarium circinatum]|uniref:Short-chain alcohol dehydrogenase n=1 Tax=Fusarium circinatum TaxID=48490 RepID=A0A8H5TB86_FUSCI|nr:short-chain alcohol dehydrogenase [Fusarium circinatum]